MAKIGIDLGTTNSLAVCWKNKKPVLVRNSMNETYTPSVVSIDEDTKEIYVGKIAQDRLISHPEASASEFKRLMGTRQEVLLNGNVYTPEELSSLVLKKIKEDAEEYLGEPVDEAIISVPAYFNDSARSATKLAASLAGLNVERLINEPSAAALSYLYKTGEDAQTLLIVDFGGGTLDVSLVETFESVIEILAVSGNNTLGGKDFNEVIANYFCEQNNLTYSTLPLNERSIIYKASEKAKIALSNSMTTMIKATVNDKELSATIDNNKLIKISSQIFSQIKAPIDKVLRDARITYENVDNIVLVGGSSKMPTVRAFIREITGISPVTDIDPDTAIAMGAGIFAEIKNRNEDLKDIIMTDICPFSLGVSTVDSMTNELITEFIISRNSSLPTSRLKEFYSMSPSQTHVKFDIYQGESIIPSKNTLLGSLVIDYANPEHQIQKFRVIMSYDINGILIVDVEGKDGHLGEKVFMNKAGELSQEEINILRKNISNASLLRRNQEKSAAIIGRAERLFEESLEVERQIIFQYLSLYKRALNGDSIKNINEAYNQLEKILDDIEGDNH